MGDYFLAIDIGASSGRHILGHLEDGKLVIQEVYRFENGMTEKNGSLVWNHEHTLKEIIAGLKKCKEIGKIPSTLAIDTWGVDFALIDANDNLIGDTVAYRDSRTIGMDSEVYTFVSADELYRKTGIQKAMYNTVFQLMAVDRNCPTDMDKAKNILLTPDYLNFLLTGVKASEYTICSTTGLLNPRAKSWDYDLLYKLGFNENMFLPVSMPGTPVGNLRNRIIEEVGFDCRVVMAPSHDTASAILAVPATDRDYIYISSGTWSLMGIERDLPDTGAASFQANFTNEGGYGGKIRYLTNIMGLWMIQSLKKELNDQYSFSELCDLAEENSEFASRVDVNDDSFLAPDSMIEAIKNYCNATRQAVPETPGELASVIYQSLAKCYADKALEIEQLSGKKYSRIHVIGGGSNASYLNKLTAKETGKRVIAGPSEATAIGNILSQMIAAGELNNTAEARRVCLSSFDTEEIIG